MRSAERHDLPIGPVYRNRLVGYRLADHCMSMWRVRFEVGPFEWNVRRINYFVAHRKSLKSHQA